jgi:hypothetical protein
VRGEGEGAVVYERAGDGRMCAWRDSGVGIQGRGTACDKEGEDWATAQLLPVCELSQGGCCL